MKVKSKSCNFYHRVETKKCQLAKTEPTVLDIEDLVKAGQKYGFCPYYMTKELKHQCDIVFMPYNYILDIKVREALGIKFSYKFVNVR